MLLPFTLFIHYSDYKTYPYFLYKRFHRYLIPSHTLKCSLVATVCTVKGCGQLVRRGEVGGHIEENLASHFAMLQRDRNNTLWKLHDPVSS